jgi:hypothetical protein
LGIDFRAGRAGSACDASISPFAYRASRAGGPKRADPADTTPSTRVDATANPREGVLEKNGGELGAAMAS